jgi:hypothetical protein
LFRAMNWKGTGITSSASESSNLYKRVNTSLQSS